MNVTFDANATAEVLASGTTSVTSSNLTIGVGSQRALVVQLCFDSKTVTGVTVTWDNGVSNQAMTLIASAVGAGAFGRAELWGLVNPVSGTKSLRAAWTGNSDALIDGVAWTSVNQTGGVTSFPNSTSATGNSTATLVTVTSAVGNATMDAVAILAVLSAPTKTQTFLNNAPANVSAGGSRAAGAASVAHQWTGGVINQWVSVGTDILAAASNATTFESHRPAPFAPSAPTLQGF